MPLSCYPLKRKNRVGQYNRGDLGRNSTPEPSEVTALLKAWRAGDDRALERLTPPVYEHLRTQARRYIRYERQGLTLQGTALVHEAFLRLVEGQAVDWRDRSHFYAVASQVMRRILVDAARARAAAKRGGGPDGAVRADVDVEAISAGSDRTADAMRALDDALDTLTRIDPRRARVVELRYFGGLSVEETAEVLRVSPKSVMRDWRTARAWLLRELRR
jgi:RNA polymerase sigma factor (TIGR02999 family)